MACRRARWSTSVQSKAACPLCRAPVQKGDLVEPSRPAAEPAEAIVSGSQASAAASAKVLALMQVRCLTGISRGAGMVRPGPGHAFGSA